MHTSAYPQGGRQDGSVVGFSDMIPYCKPTRLFKMLTVWSVTLRVCGWSKCLQNAMRKCMYSADVLKGSMVVESLFASPVAGREEKRIFA